MDATPSDIDADKIQHVQIFCSLFCRERARGRAKKVQIKYAKFTRRMQSIRPATMTKDRIECNLLCCYLSMCSATAHISFGAFEYLIIYVYRWVGHSQNCTIETRLDMCARVRSADGDIDLHLCVVRKYDFIFCAPVVRCSSTPLAAF